MKKLLKRFIVWLFKDEFDKYLNQMSELKSLQYYLEDRREIMDVILKHTKIAVDVDKSGRDRFVSYALFCIKGKEESIMFFHDLSSEDIHEIKTFLRHFQNKNIMFDAPIGVAGFFRNY